MPRGSESNVTCVLGRAGDVFRCFSPLNGPLACGWPIIGEEKDEKINPLCRWSTPQCSAAPNTFSRRLFFGGERSRLPAKHAPPVFSTSSTSRGSSQLGIKFHLRIRCEQWGEFPSLFAWFTHMVRHSPACRDRTSTARFIAAVTPLSLTHAGTSTAHMSNERDLCTDRVRPSDWQDYPASGRDSVSGRAVLACEPRSSSRTKQAKFRRISV